MFDMNSFTNSFENILQSAYEIYFIKESFYKNKNETVKFNII